MANSMHFIRSTVDNDAYFHAALLQMDWPTIPIMTVLVGILTICAGMSIIILMYRGFDSARLGLLVCILTMYTGTVAYWVLTLSSYSLHVSNTANIVTRGHNLGARENQNPRASPAPPEGTSPWAFGTSPDPAMRPEDLQMCTGMAALLINITLGDGIVWWRAWAVCGRKRRILCLAVGLLVCMLAVGVTEAAEACSSIRPLLLTTGSTTLINAVVGAMFIGNNFGFVSSVVTLLTNVVATSLIAYQAWVHSRMVRDCHLNTFPSRVGVKAVLALLVESGVLYCVVWALVAAYEVTQIIAFFDPQATASITRQRAYILFGWYLIEGALVPLIAIYPTVIIILVTLGNSCFEAATTSASLGPSLPLFAPSGESSVLSESVVARIEGLGAIRSSSPTPTPSSLSG